LLERCCARSGKAAALNGCADFLERGREALGFDGLQQVIECADVEGFHGVMIVCRRENDARRPVELLQQIESGSARHLHVEEYDLGGKLFDAFTRLIDIARLTGDLDPGEGAQQPAQLAACERLVIDDECFHGEAGLE
jgi:hypothetical protein